METFLISGREGTGTLTAILLVQRRELDETAQLLSGVKQIENYPIFMAEVNNVGYDRRGNAVYVKDAEGREITVDREIKSGDNKVSIIQEKVINNELPEIVEKYLKFAHDLRDGKVFYDVAEGVYRVL